MGIMLYWEQDVADDKKAALRVQDVATTGDHSDQRQGCPKVPERQLRRL